MRLSTLPETELRRQIEELQGVQKTHPPTSSAWQTASELLAPLFNEMRRRHGSDPA